ncbi:MAG TPA: HAD family hydrolase, partial [Firmicutes bacterium]|nr:HAD family hydrolase [Bacillota bacterium]
MKAVLFDMDGTLLGVDMYEVFLSGYVKRLGDFVADRADERYFIKQLMAATNAMVSNEDPSLTNA